MNRCSNGLALPGVLALHCILIPLPFARHTPLVCSVQFCAAARSKTPKTKNQLINVIRMNVIGARQDSDVPEMHVESTHIHAVGCFCCCCCCCGIVSE